jgi:hypothetical protein
MLFAAASAAVGVFAATVGALLGWAACLVGGVDVDVVEDDDVPDPSPPPVVAVSP